MVERLEVLLDCFQRFDGTNMEPGSGGWLCADDFGRSQAGSGGRLVFTRSGDGGYGFCDLGAE
jgi:hypothetical protein